MSSIISILLNFLKPFLGLSCLYIEPVTLSLNVGCQFSMLTNFNRKKHLVSGSFRLVYLDVQRKRFFVVKYSLIMFQYLMCTLSTNNILTSNWKAFVTFRAN